MPFAYTNIDEFQLEFLLAHADDDEGSTFDEEVNIVDIFVSGQSICKDIDDQPLAEGAWVKSFDVKAIPVGFEYTYDHEK